MRDVMRSLFMLADDGCAPVPVDGRPPHTERLPRWSPEPDVRESGREASPGGVVGEPPVEPPGRVAGGEPGEVDRHVVAGDPESKRKHPGGMHG